MPACAAGCTAFAWYLFGALPLQLEIAEQMGSSAQLAASAICIVWLTGAAVSIGLGAYYRLPLAVTWSVPGLVYLGSLAGQFSPAEIAAANLVAGLAIVAIGWLGLGQRIMAWLPLQIVMAMFAGSILSYVTRMVGAVAEDPLVAGAPAAAFLAGRLLASPRLPPIALAALAAVIVLAFTGSPPRAAVSDWTPLSPQFSDLRFSADAILAIGVPMTVLALGLGNVQGLGFLALQGYRVPITPITVAVGLASAVNARFGGHAATVARAGSAIVAGAEAGAPRQRYRAALLAAGLSLSIALAAGTLGAWAAAIPRSLLVTLTALAILSSLQDALEKSFNGPLRFGALVAFAVAATPFAILGIGSAFWSVFAGIGAALVAERKALIAHWLAATQKPHAPAPERA
jgi:benzoate membrane transport protein